MTLEQAIWWMFGSTAVFMGVGGGLAYAVYLWSLPRKNER